MIMNMISRKRLLNSILEIIAFQDRSKPCISIYKHNPQLDVEVPLV